MAPTQVPWGQKAFNAYLGPDQKTWTEYDSCTLMASRGWARDILIDQGEADEFLAQQLRPELFVEACKARRVPLTSWFRFRRAVEGTPTVLVVLEQEPFARAGCSRAMRPR